MMRTGGKNLKWKKKSARSVLVDARGRRGVRGNMLWNLRQDCVVYRRLQTGARVGRYFGPERKQTP